MEVIIRSAKPEDAPGLARVNIASWNSTYRGLIADETLDGMKFEDYLKKWENIIANQKQGNGFTLVAENDSTIIGYSCCGKNRKEAYSFGGELYAIYLLKEHQGKGIGKKLFLRSIEEFKKRQIDSFLLFVLKKNTSSRKFYETFRPDFTREESFAVDNREYVHTCYGWSDSKSIIS